MTRRPVDYRHETLDSAKPLTPRQELYAQAIARGMSQAAAYREAGYKGATNTQRMCKFPNIQARVEQLLAEAAARSVVTADQISAQLQEIIARSKDGDSAPMLQTTRAAVMDLAKIHGLLDPRNQARAQGAAPAPITEIRRVVVEPDGRKWTYGKSATDGLRRR